MIDVASWDDASWWAGACEEDTTFGLELDGDDGAWMKGFLPPPPRPNFLAPSPSSDGLTTCDLCAWATQPPTFVESLTALPWLATLIIVSILSAIVGAALMLTLRKCMKGLKEDEVSRFGEGNDRRSEIKDRPRGLVSNSHVSNRRGQEGRDNVGSVLWCWICRRPSNNLRNEMPSAPNNHYTVEEPYAGAAEALYAELDKPVYQNTGYVLDADTGSPPSSAYYSDLSDRTYETVGTIHHTQPHHNHQNQWEMLQPNNIVLSSRRLAAIAEAATHSDYV